MGLSDFEIHLNDRSAGFWCFEGRDNSKTPAFLATVRNRINAPADDLALATIESLLGPEATAVKSFYSQHDGVLMYEDTMQSSSTLGHCQPAGIRLFAVSEWQANSNEMRAGLTNMGLSEAEMIDWLRDGIAFGEIPYSGNYFVIQPEGENAGKVFYVDHDGFDPDPIAASFEQFLDMILADPADFLYQRGCYTRYSDGKSSIQWIPKQYVTRKT